MPLTTTLLTTGEEIWYSYQNIDYMIIIYVQQINETIISGPFRNVLMSHHIWVLSHLNVNQPTYPQSFFGDQGGRIPPNSFWTFWLILANQRRNPQNIFISSSDTKASKLWIWDWSKLSDLSLKIVIREIHIEKIWAEGLPASRVHQIWTEA